VKERKQMSSATFARGASFGARVVSAPALISTGIGAGAGAAAAWGAQMLVEHTDFFRKYWYAPALSVAFLGHVAKSMKNDKVAAAGMAAVGAAGAMGYYSYKLNAASAKASGETTGVQADVGSPSDDYVDALRALPDAAGVQDYGPTMRSSNPIAGMRTAA
jgi:hypothetical protein